RSDIVSKEVLTAGREILGSMAAYKKVEDMINIGAYAHGANVDIDRAIGLMPRINAFLRQAVAEPSHLEDSFTALQGLTGVGQAGPAGPGGPAGMGGPGGQGGPGGAPAPQGGGQPPGMPIR
ncbi:flagellum-specific ATP synthase FliI, partial [Desulfovibrio sp. OttesenSCG-928-C06]|nr:flagellum-specific ATP synthase FliI [Desulfovibrio sp. OttesenSCG-928-C06]